ncbi:hypothetical protein E3Q24_03482 [Wallemia mellicola]|nr:hypothetical protein E3Q24_03482 [Wallemia mellicola]
MVDEIEGVKHGNMTDNYRDTSRVSSSSSDESDDNESEVEIVKHRHPAERKRRLSSLRRLKFTRASRRPSSSKNDNDRSSSPPLEPLRDGTSASETESAPESSFRPKNNAFDDADDEVSDEDLFDNSQVDSDDEDLFNYDEELYYNTEANAQFIIDKPLYLPPADDQHLLDEGPNITKPLHDTPHKRSNNLDLNLTGPKFEKNRCTITIRQGDPDQALITNNRRRKRYILASDLSHESKYAVEWAIGTVLRDGDELFIATVQETDTKLDGRDGKKADKTKSQRERAVFSQYLTKHAISLLQRTKLHVIVTCQAVHAKNSRHMLIDMIDFIEPTLAIVGSRGRSDITGILLGSTSHYLVQKSSVPVMVARKRIKHPPRKRGNADLQNRRHVPLTSAAIDSVAARDESKLQAQEDEFASESGDGDAGDEDEDGKELGN